MSVRDAWKAVRSYKRKGFGSNGEAGGFNGMVYQPLSRAAP